MRIEIDQSGKIENTNKPTVIAFSNSKSGTLIISPRDKKQIQNLFRRAGNSKIFTFKTFAILIFLLIKENLNRTSQIVIDREYPGYDKLIKQFILEICLKEGMKLDPTIIHFSNIGKKSRAHDLAIKSFRKKRGDIKIKYKDFLKVLL